MNLKQILEYCNGRHDCAGCPFYKNYAYYKLNKNSGIYKVECKITMLRWDAKYHDTLEKVGE